MRLAIRACAISLIVAFAAQIAWAGGRSSGGGSVHVRSYYRKDGTYVHSYNRAAGASSYSRTAGLSNSTRKIAIDFIQPASIPYGRPVTPTANPAFDLSRTSSSKTPYFRSSATVSSSLGVQRDTHGRIKRSEAAKHEFMRTTGYPKGRPGYVVDHIIPLKRGGCDCPPNMQWQTIQEAKAKDKWE
jgi:hypothetical protein